MKTILLYCFVLLIAFGCEMKEADSDPTAAYIGDWTSQYVEDEFTLTVMKLTIEKSGERRLRIVMFIHTEAKGNFDVPDDEYRILEDVIVPTDGTPSFDYTSTGYGRTVSVHGSMIVDKSKLSVAMTGVDHKINESKSIFFVLNKH